MSLDTSKGHKDMAYPQHVSTYASFIKASIASIVFLILLLASMAYFLV